MESYLSQMWLKVITKKNSKCSHAVLVFVFLCIGFFTFMKWLIKRVRCVKKKISWKWANKALLTGVEIHPESLANSCKGQLVWRLLELCLAQSGMFYIDLQNTSDQHTTILEVKKLCHSICWYLWIYDLFSRSVLPSGHETFLVSSLQTEQSEIIYYGDSLLLFQHSIHREVTHQGLHQTLWATLQHNLITSPSIVKYTTPRRSVLFNFRTTSAAFHLYMEHFKTAACDYFTVRF